VKTVRTVEELRRAVAAARSAGRTVGFVPTMGFLHDGHLSLVDEVKGRSGLVVMSIFVNPLQFGPGEDFQAYPRDEGRDAELAERRGVDLLYAPGVEEVYPDGEAGMVVRVVPRRLADRLCGLARPVHFEGVLTVVAKLFGMVQPDVAVFGQKDWQQATLIRRMVRDLDMAVEVVVAPIVREEDGLAMSSRNTYLTPPLRERALSLSRGLFAARDAFAGGVTDAERLKAKVRGTMRGADVEPEYVELVDPDSLDPLEEAVPGALLAIAARLGETRLIDNVILEQ
jgi:pantoate--beta-alanine ligase